MNDSEGESQGFGYGAFESGGRVLDLLAALVPALADQSASVSRQNIRRSCITVTELADSLVRLEGLSFREAHEIAAEVARAVVAIEGDIATDGYQAFQEAFRTLRRPQDAGRADAVRRRSSRRRTSLPSATVSAVPLRRRFLPRLPDTTREIADIRSRMRETEKHAVASAQDLQSRFTALLGGR